MAGFWASFFGLVRPASLRGHLTAEKPEQRPNVCLFLARSQSKSGDIGPNPYRHTAARLSRHKYWATKSKSFVTNKAESKEMIHCTLPIRDSSPTFSGTSGLQGEPRGPHMQRHLRRQHGESKQPGKTVLIQLAYQVFMASSKGKRGQLHNICSINSELQLQNVEELKIHISGRKPY